MDSQIDSISKEIKSNKSASAVSNPRSEIYTIQNKQLSGSKIDKFIVVHPSYDKNSDSEDECYPLQASKMKDLRHPAKPLYRSETNVDKTIVSEEDSEEEDYHT